MTNELIAITLIWGFIFIYAVMATMDFGAGFWSMVYINQEKTKATNIANRYLSPTWEVTNVFIVAIVVALVSFFPGATFLLGTVLLVPGSIILLLLAIRSAFLVFAHITKEYEKALTYISGITGIIIPALLISVLPITHGEFIEMKNGTPALNISRLLTSPHEYAFIGFAISSTLFLSSLLLADYSNVADENDAYRIYRRDALILGPISLLMALFIMLTMQREATWLYEKMMNYLPWLIGSVLMFFVAGIALFLPSTKHKEMRGRPRLAVVAIVIQYFLASYAYGKAHLPYMIYPDVTIQSGFTHPNTFRALFASYIVGFLILFPGFVYFWRLFMKDQRYVRQKNEG
ncbi:cytochrome d ubiquinol oxidase subunit II [Thermaerobacillus caldiproteolyticus]|uniref:Cytochrome d ubiquinol oxidase subunit II n=1 Tax=Thermaerobacillus caldiproteolyticus TaxID=247480 RepID=A0A7V9Z4Q4_9BACL|nr:cytochrome d ubiquinol oxidase subunit II [Anoxybacillus caldiproteolyticus]MBA2873913.1 cytochrome d ubiquinol oxidase subunit II [Anoxybacillus caldiproteolyticus]